jgi:hypothetical protein
MHHRKIVIIVGGATNRAVETRGTESLLTLRWRETDSNPRSPVRESASFTFEPSAGIRDPRGPTAGGDGFEPLVPRKENGFRDCRRLAFHARGLTMSAISDVIAANILVASFL